MRARLRAFVGKLIEHPIGTAITFAWPWIFWFLDKVYGDRIYKWLTAPSPPGSQPRPAIVTTLTTVATWFGDHMLAINASAFLAWIAFLFYRMWTESRPTRPSKPASEITLPEVNRIERANDPIIVAGFEFYPGRASLSEHRHLRGLLQSAKTEIWAMWNTGLHAARSQLLATPHKKLILVPHVDVAQILADAENVYVDTVTHEIRELTSEALTIKRQNPKIEIDVRWLTAAPRNTLVLGDPDSPDAWAFVEWFQPGVPEDQRPCVWFTKARLPAVWGFLHDMFELHWNTKSADPRWRASIEASDGSVAFTLRARFNQPPIIVEGLRLTIRTPEVECSTLDNHRFSLDTTSSHSFVYPRDFPANAPPPKDGGYTSRWEIYDGKVWKTAVIESREITLAKSVGR